MEIFEVFMIYHDHYEYTHTSLIILSALGLSSIKKTTSKSLGMKFGTFGGGSGHCEWSTSQSGSCHYNFNFAKFLKVEPLVGVSAGLCEVRTISRMRYCFIYPYCVCPSSPLRILLGGFNLANIHFERLPSFIMRCDLTQKLAKHLHVRTN